MARLATLVTRTATTHHGREAAVAAAGLPASRATAPARDWVGGLGGLPAPLWWGDTPCSQNVVDCDGSRAKPVATVAAKVATAVAAARYRRVRSKEATKISGGGLMPAVRPTPMARHQP